MKTPETKPIIFSGPMVRALLDGRKTQTRRVIKDRGVPPQFCGGRYDDKNSPEVWGWEDCDRGEWVTLDQWRHWRFVPYAPGDLLWVREAWQAHSWASDCVTIRYRAQEKTAGFTAQVEQIAYPEGNKNAFKYVAPKGPNHWRPSIHMPRWASRLTLRVTDVRVQRVQEISREDAIAEGCCGATSPHTPHGPPEGVQSATEDFADLWDSLNAKRGHGWDTNPWVVAYTFDVIRQNVDEVPA